MRRFLLLSTSALIFLIISPHSMPASKSREIAILSTMERLREFFTDKFPRLEQTEWFRLRLTSDDFSNPRLYSTFCDTFFPLEPISSAKGRFFEEFFTSKKSSSKILYFKTTPSIFPLYLKSPHRKRRRRPSISATVSRPFARNSTNIKSRRRPKTNFYRPSSKWLSIRRRMAYSKLRKNWNAR